jgi:V8-like Glu-specific endopeptidase
MNAALCSILLAGTTLAQAPTWATHCRIDSVYQTQNGTLIHALVEIDNDRGAYTLYGFNIRASLRDIRYVPSMAHPQGRPSAAIVGSWHWPDGRQSGYFVFREPTPDGFVDGYWGFGNRIEPRGVRTWDGIIQVLDTNQPPPAAPRPVPRRPNFGKDLLPQFNGLPEAFVGENSANVPDNWFPKGSSLGQSVGQLVTDDGTGWGVCFVVGEGVVLTVKHVLDAIGNRQAVVRFQTPGTASYYSFEIAGAPFVFGNDDIAIIRLVKNQQQPWPPRIGLPKFANAAQNQIPARNFNARNAEIIHFPKNQGRRTNIRGHFLDPPLENGYKYTNETEPGSSGAPVFDLDWNLVAIHWGAQRRTDGKPPEFNLGYKIEFVVFWARQHLGQSEEGRQVLTSMGL